MFRPPKHSSFTRSIVVSERKVKFLLLVSILIVILCSVERPFVGGVKVNNYNPKDETKMLEEQGYSDIKIVGTQSVSISRDENSPCFPTFEIIAEATNSNGEKVDLSIYSTPFQKDVIKVKAK